jgi:hypothetical protein
VKIRTNFWRPRIRLRFGLRSLFFVVLIVAALCAWLGKHVVRASIQRPIVAAIKDAGGDVSYDYEINPEFNRAEKWRAPTGSPLVRRILGDDIFATVRVVWFLNRNARDSDVVNLHRLPGLLDVSLSGRQVTDACIKDLLRIKNLRALMLSDTAISAEGIHQLSSCKTLESLTLNGSRISDAHLKHLVKFPKLRHLQVIRTSITDAGMRAIGSIKDLTTLDIFFAKGVSDNGVKELASQQSLQQLKLLETSITDESMAIIGGLKQLRFLDLNSAPITDAGFQQLSGLTNLEAIEVGNTQFSDDGLRAISKASNLRYFLAAGTKITDQGMKYLTQLPKLEYLRIGNTAVTDIGLEQLATLSNLKSLDVGINQNCTLAGVKTLKKFIPACVIDCWDYGPDGTGTKVEIE